MDGETDAALTCAWGWSVWCQCAPSVKSMAPAGRRRRRMAPFDPSARRNVPSTGTARLPIRAAGHPRPVQDDLDPAALELRDRARRYVREVLRPLEDEFERAAGRLSRKQGRDLRQAAIEARLHGGSLPRELGGQGWTVTEQVIVHEQLGQVTGGLWSYIPGAYNALVHATPEQRVRYLEPSLRGERSGSYAVTEEAAGSDARNLAATAVRDAATG